MCFYFGNIICSMTSIMTWGGMNQWIKIYWQITTINICLVLFLFCFLGVEGLCVGVDVVCNSRVISLKNTIKIVLHGLPQHKWYELVCMIVQRQSCDPPVAHPLCDPCNLCTETQCGINKWKNAWNMMTSSNGNIFRVTGPLCGEFTGNRWIPHTKARDAELWCFLWSASV